MNLEHTEWALAHHTSGCRQNASTQYQKDLYTWE